MKPTHSAASKYTPAVNHELYNRTGELWVRKKNWTWLIAGKHNQQVVFQFCLWMGLISTTLVFFFASTKVHHTFTLLALWDPSSIIQQN
jgi:hypothetical protein